MSAPVRGRLAAAGLVLALSGCTATTEGPAPAAEPPAESPSSPSVTPSPERSAEATPTTPPPAPSPAPSREVTVTFVGDIMLGRRVAATHADPTVTLRPMRRLLRRADITVGNLENTLSTAGPPTQGGDSFSAPPSVLTGLADAGLDVLSLANNHTGDHGTRALLDTVAAFRSSGIAAVGAGRDLAAALRPVVVERQGVRVGFLAFNAIGETPMAAPGRPGALSVRMPPRTGPVDDGDVDRLARAVRRLDARVDAVVVLPHWGEQYVHRPWPSQSQVGRRLIDAGADLVVGGHPHWVQSVERYRGVRIFHSLGNFVFDMDFMEQTMEGVALTVTLREGRFRDVELTPYRLDAGFTPRPLTAGEGRQVLADMGVRAPAS